MATDYAKRSSSRGARRRSRNPRTGPVGFSWGSFVSGMVIGVGLTLAGALLPEWWPATEAALSVTTPRAAADTPLSPADAGAAPLRDAAPTEPRFTFWDELPRDRAPVRDRRESASARSGADRTPATTAAATEAVEYLLQAGSFARTEEAERLRGALLLLGLEASTVTVTLPGGAVRHRVLVGPFADERTMRRAQAQLRDQDIEPLPLRRNPS
jgi:cell division protein FtsN